MRAAVMTNWTMRVEDLDVPTPANGQVLTRVRACGICGSDLHMLAHGAEQRALSAGWAEWADPPAIPSHMFSPELGCVMGHEFCCEVVDIGPGVSTLEVGDIVVSMPALVDAAGMHPIGYSNIYNGGYADMMILQDVLALKVPNGCDPTLAAMTEPLAVGVHAVAKSGIAPGHSAIVLGLGPVGLAVIAELRMKGIGPIVGADYSPRRRELAAVLGADLVVDPREMPAIEAWRSLKTNNERWVFEAVGVPGLIDGAMRMAPRGGHVLVVGVCMQPDTIAPLLGISREINIQFVLGYTPDEFAYSLNAIAHGDVDLSPLITGIVDVDGVPGAFDDLGNPEAHAKIVVVPAR